jgi:hypothetical protein
VNIKIIEDAFKQDKESKNIDISLHKIGKWEDKFLLFNKLKF